MSKLKVSAGLIIIAAGLLLFSVLPRPAGVTPTPPDLAAEGRALFQAKGCLTCHRHDAVVQVPSDSMTSVIWSDIGAPDLTDYQANPDFLRTWLKDPAAVRPATRMPNLELKDWEIEALITFLGSSAGPGS